MCSTPSLVPREGREPGPGIRPGAAAAPRLTQVPWLLFRLFLPSFFFRILRAGGTLPSVPSSALPNRRVLHLTLLKLRKGRPVQAADAPANRRHTHLFKPSRTSGNHKQPQGSTLLLTVVAVATVSRGQTRAFSALAGVSPPARSPAQQLARASPGRRWYCSHSARLARLARLTNKRANPTQAFTSPRLSLSSPARFHVWLYPPSSVAMPTRGGNVAPVKSCFVETRHRRQSAEPTQLANIVFGYLTASGLRGNSVSLPSCQPADANAANSPEACWEIRAAHLTFDTR